MVAVIYWYRDFARGRTVLSSIYEADYVTVLIAPKSKIVPTYRGRFTGVDCQAYEINEASGKKYGI